MYSMLASRLYASPMSVCHRYFFLRHVILYRVGVMLKELFEIRKTTRKWHMAVLAGLCVGVPIMGGYFIGNMADGKLASLAGLVILYIYPQNTGRQMTTLMACSF